MNSREILRRTLDYDDPERVARSFHGSDMASCGCSAKTHATDWKVVGESRWERQDEWGNLWGRIDPTSKGEVVRGVLDDVLKIETYAFPDFSRPEDYDGVRELRGSVPDKWLVGGMPGFAFNIARKMRTLEHYLADILLERDRMEALHDRIDRMLEDMIRNYAAAGVDSVMFPEDWGSQTQTLISPELWHELFFPRFRRLCGIAHECGIKVFMHSCGQTEAIVPGLMEAGIDLLHFDQPDLHGIDNLAAHQKRGRITFWCPVDIQTTLQRRDETVIRTKVEEMLDKLWKGRGGLIAGCYSDDASIGLEPHWQEFACQVFLEQGIRSRYATRV